jgi:hypothetical protein
MIKAPASISGFLARLLRNEDWLAVLIALFLILLSVAGLLGKSGIPIHF